MKLFGVSEPTCRCYLVFQSLHAGIILCSRAYMKVLLYLVEFDHINVPQTLQSFHKCNKEGLVRGIWRNHSHQRRVS